MKLNDISFVHNPTVAAFSTTPSPWGRAGVGLQVGMLLFLILFVCSCITDFEPKGIDEISSILVVEGIITDDETTITLSRSANLLSDDLLSSYTVDNARVYVECDDGTLFQADDYFGWLSREGKYTIITGQLDLKRKYSLKIEVEEYDFDDAGRMLGGANIYVYSSVFSYPIQTPEIDSVFWIKRDKGQPVMIHVATHSPNNEILYCRWSYKEDWEIISEFNMEGHPRYCWANSISRNILLGSAEKTVFGQLMNKITEIVPSNPKLSELYRIDVKQNAISKRAYDYFTNIRSNSENIGSIFAPIPSELRGNIACITDLGRPVVGYVDISSTKQKRKYISRQQNAYERPNTDCFVFTMSEWCEWMNISPEECGRTTPIDHGWIVYDSWPILTYVKPKCVDCIIAGGQTTIKPDDWPNYH
jgi:hypothetical protein